MSAFADMYIASPDWIKILWISLPCVTLYATARLFSRGKKTAQRQQHYTPPVITTSRDPDFDQIAMEGEALKQAFVKQLRDEG